MHVSLFWEHFRDFWRPKIAAYGVDIRRIDAASRPMAATMLFLGIMHGLIPLGLLVVLFRMADAVVGARAVRIATDDVRLAVAAALALWLIVTCLVVGKRILQGVAARLTAQTAYIVTPLSLLVCMGLLMPLRILVIALVVLIAEAWATVRWVHMASIAIVALLGLSAMGTLVGYMTSRALTVGSFLMMVGMVMYFVHWYALHRIAARE